MCEVNTFVENCVNAITELSIKLYNKHYTTAQWFNCSQSLALYLLTHYEKLCSRKSPGYTRVHIYSCCGTIYIIRMQVKCSSYCLYINVISVTLWHGCWCHNTAEDHIGFHSSQPRAGIWGYSGHRFTWTRQLKLQKNVSWSMSEESQFLFWHVDGKVHRPLINVLRKVWRVSVHPFMATIYHILMTTFRMRMHQAKVKFSWTWQ